MLESSSCWFVANADVVDKDVEPKFWILSLAELRSMSAAYLLQWEDEVAKAQFQLHCKVDYAKCRQLLIKLEAWDLRQRLENSSYCGNTMDASQSWLREAAEAFDVSLNRVPGDKRSPFKSKHELINDVAASVASAANKPSLFKIMHEFINNVAASVASVAKGVPNKLISLGMRCKLTKPMSAPRFFRDDMTVFVEDPPDEKPSHVPVSAEVDVHVEPADVMQDSDNGFEYADRLEMSLSSFAFVDEPLQVWGITGQNPATICQGCHGIFFHKMQYCSMCYQVDLVKIRYCSRQCQKADWSCHRRQCRDRRCIERRRQSALEAYLRRFKPSESDWSLAACAVNVECVRGPGAAMIED